MSYDYDLFVIGAGSGGVRAARMSAGFGARVAIAEEYRVGGTCVIRGCVPKKLFVYASLFGGDIDDAKGFGWSVTGKRFDWSILKSNKDKEIDRLSGIYARNLEKAGVTLFEDRATLQGPHTIHLGKENRTITADKILVATGAVSFVPDIPGSDYSITSNEAFELDALPRSIIIVGGGYIAVEFACIFNGLGVDVTLLYRGEQILRGFDDDMRSGLAQEMIRQGIGLKLNANPACIENGQGTYRVTLEDGRVLSTDLVMYAAGRRPNTEGLGLTENGINLGKACEIPVDEYSKTEIDNIYAVGDVTDRANLTPVAIREGAAFAETAFNNNPIAVDHELIPTAVFSQPEIGTVGMTEAEARAAYSQVDIYKSRFRPMKHTLSGKQEHMIMKLIVDGASGRLLGCHILGADASEIVQVVAVAMRLGATKDDLDQTMALHPSAAEELVTMREKWQPSSSEPA